MFSKYDINYDINIVYQKNNKYFISIELFVILITFNCLMYLNRFLHINLKKHNVEYLKLDNYKQKYVIKNISKCFWLFGLSFFSIYILIQTIIHNIWDTHLVNILGAVYGLPDTYSLITIPNLPKSTKIHHAVVTFLWILNYFQTIEVFHYWRGIVVYALFSILCGSVNGYLGYRLIFPDSEYRQTFKKFARYNYIFCFISIWIYQYFTIGTWLNVYGWKCIGFWIYFISSHLIMYDDIILIRFLKKDARVKENKLE